MTVIQWSKPGDRVYESGLDRGVLYLPDGSGVPWNGLVSVVERHEKEISSVYYDGAKISDLVVLGGGFSASLSAVTYPEEFDEIEGLGSETSGVYYADQMPKSFGLSYRTMIGNDVDGPASGYKLHILYNLTAIPSDKTYASLGSDPSLVEFEWEISAVPEEVPGFRPTAHIILDSREIDSELLAALEDILYGSVTEDASLPSMSDLVSFINDFYRIRFVDNGDGTWTATTDDEGYIVTGPNGYFEINDVDAWYLNTTTFVAKDTSGVVPVIRIHNVGDGTFTIHSEFEEMIVVDESTGLATIYNATVEYLDQDTYLIENTVE